MFCNYSPASSKEVGTHTLNILVMKNFYLLVLFLGLVALTHVHANNEGENLTKDFIIGDPGIESINALAFGPSGILFVGDAQKANVVAIDTKDTDASGETGNVNMNKVDEKIAALLGASVDDIQIVDMAVNPISQNIYLAVRHSNGTPMLVKTDGQSMEVMPMDKVSHSKVDLSNPVAV